MVSPPPGPIVASRPRQRHAARPAHLRPRPAGPGRPVAGPVRVRRAADPAPVRPVDRPDRLGGRLVVQMSPRRRPSCYAGGRAAPRPRSPRPRRPARRSPAVGRLGRPLRRHRRRHARRRRGRRRRRHPARPALTGADVGTPIRKAKRVEPQIARISQMQRPVQSPGTRPTSPLCNRINPWFTPPFRARRRAPQRKRGRRSGMAERPTLRPPPRFRAAVVKRSWWSRPPVTSLTTSRPSRPSRPAGGLRWRCTEGTAS